MAFFRSRLLGAMLFALAGLLGQAASAQTVDALTTSAGNFARDRSIAVLDRPHPELEPQGIGVGSFRLLPKIDLTALYVDNIYATDTARRGDAIGIVDPSFKLNSNWSRHRLSIAGDAALVRYARTGSQNVETYDVNGFGQLDVGSEAMVRGYVDYGRLAERRSDIGVPNNTATPILYNVLNANGSGQWQGSRFKLVGTLGVTTLRYQDNVTRDGVAAPQGYRERNSYRGTVRGEYALTPDFSLLVQGALTQARFIHPEQSAFNRNSNRQELLGGASLELTQLLRAEVGVGYIHLRYTAADLPRFSGVGGRVQVEFFPSQLTTVTARASRTIEDSGLPSAPTYVRTLAGVQVDHELLRNVVLSASAAYSNNNFNLQSRQEHRPEFFVRGIYTLNRHLSLTARYDHIDSRARPLGSGKTFAFNQLSFSISARL